jgi:hypothetical protein
MASQINDAGCNGPMALVRELRRVTPDMCMDASVRVAELCQEAARHIATAEERVRRRRHALRAPEGRCVMADTGWRPIETAPKYQRVLVNCRRWGVTEAMKYHQAGWKAFGVGGVYGCEPTHWMPLPSPPEPSNG